MHESMNQKNVVEARSRLARANAGSTFFEAALLLLIGFVLIGGLYGLSDWELFNMTIAVTIWTFKIGGILMLGTAVLCWIGCPKALAFDAGVNGLVGSVLILASVVWLMAGSLYGLLFILFGGMQLNSMRSSWRNYRLTGILSPNDHNSRPVGETKNRSTVHSVEQIRAILDRQAEEAEPIDRRVQQSEEVKPAERETNPPVRPAFPQAKESPPEGFLAELGRRDKKDPT